MTNNPKNSLLLFSILFLFFIQILFTRCANRIAPSGGPKDSIPPIVIRSIPANQSLNYTGDVVVIEFNEWIKEKNFRQELLITPPTNEYTHKITKTRVEINFNKPLLENTTYSLNFRGGIIDITEGNIARNDTANVNNLKLSFSTGDHIDSMRVSGRVFSTMTNEPVKEAIVSLYNTEDTLAIDEDTPYYFTITDEEGYFQIENIKDGAYEIFALKDYIENLIYEEREKELIGFLASPIVFNDSTSEINDLSIKLNKEDFTPPEADRSSAVGENYEIQISEGLVDFDLEPLDSTQNNLIASNLVNKGTVIRVYNLESVYDTIPARLYMEDSLGNNAEEEIKILFKEPSKKQTVTHLPFQIAISPIEGKSLEDDFQIFLTFTKPVKNYDFSKISYIIDNDSTTLAPLLYADSTQEYSWNRKQTRLDINKDLRIESVINILFDSLAFVSVQEDTTSFFNKKIDKKDPANFGTISGQVNTSVESYILQLIDDQKNVIDKRISPRQFEFAYLPAGKYAVRVIIDTNQNGQWDSSNYTDRTPAEEVLFFSLPNEGKLRERWDIQNAVIEF